MTGKNIFNLSSRNSKKLAVLIDPDKSDEAHIEKVIKNAIQCEVDYFFVGGSLLTTNDLDRCIQLLKKQTSIPIVLFPGSPLQIHSDADAILLLSLISGRNAELLIGQHVIAAPLLKKSGLEILPTGYLLVDGDKPTTASYISNTAPIPANKPEIAATTALAGEMLGLQYIYCDAGSGASKPVSKEMVAAIRENVSIPIIIGGGIKSANQARELYDAGADILVVGNAIENDPDFIKEIKSSSAVQSIR